MNYIGPIDGHNLDLLIQLFQKYKEKELHGPVFLHINYRKRKGYAPAENSNDKFHGVSSFDIQTGYSKQI